MLSLCVASPAASQSRDTLAIRADRSVELQIAMPQGAATAMLQRLPSGRVQLRVELPDATPSWRDGVTVFIDPVGDTTPAPGHDDFEYAFQRVLDSSVVRQAAHGTWMAPANDPDWRLGSARGMETWTVAVTTDANRWVLVLEIDEAWLAGTQDVRARLGLLLHDDDPNRWAAWPAGPAGRPPTQIGMRPVQWSPVLLR